MAEDYGECTFWVFSGERVGILGPMSELHDQIEECLNTLTCMANARVEDLDANFMSFWRRDFDIFD